MKVDGNFGGGCGQKECSRSGHGTLKVTLSQDWTVEIKRYFASWYKSRKANSYFNDF